MKLSPNSIGSLRDRGLVVDDAPSVVIWNACGFWQIQVSEYVPGPGDFHRQFEAEEDAVDDVLSFLFT